MEYRELGRTGLKLSALGFGASSLEGVFHDLREAYQASFEQALGHIV